MNFIELTTKGNKRIIGSISKIQRVFITSKGKTAIVGWNNNGWLEVEETYEEVIDILTDANSNVKRKK